MWGRENDMNKKHLAAGGGTFKTPAGTPMIRTHCGIGLNPRYNDIAIFAEDATCAYCVTRS